MYVNHFDITGDPMHMALKQEAISKATKALKLYKRTGRIAKDALDSVREAISYGFTVTAELSQDNLRAELAQDEQFDAEQIEADGVTDVKDAAIDDFLNRRAK